MKFNVSSSKLFSQLQAVSRVINSKNALSILDDVLFDLAGNELRLTASDGETTIRTSVEVEGVEGSGKVASAAKLLLETLKEFSEQPLAFTIDENNFAVSMVSQNGTYSFVGVNGNEAVFRLLLDVIIAEHQQDIFLRLLGGVGAVRVFQADLPHALLVFFLIGSDRIHGDHLKELFYTFFSKKSIRKGGFF